MNIEFKSTIFSTKRNLRIEDDLSLVDLDLKGNVATIFHKADITGFRFGVSWITGYQFTIGRVYCLDIRNKEDKVMKIRLRSIYGIRKKQLGDKYFEILNTIIDTYFTDICNACLDALNKNEILEFESIRISKEGVLIKMGNEIIKWEDLAIGKFYNYLSLTSKQNSKNYIQLYFLKDWNTFLIQIIVEQLAKG